MVGARDRHLHATSVVSLAIPTCIVINHQDKEEICIPYRPNFNRSSDFGIEIRGDEAGSSRLTVEEKGKTKVLSMVRLEKCGSKDPVVMPIGKMSTKEKEGKSGVGPSKKKGKMHEGEDAKVK